MRREQFAKKWSGVDPRELDRKWRTYLREQEEMRLYESLGRSAQTAVGGTGSGGAGGATTFFMDFAGNAWPVLDENDINQWNTLFDLPAYGTPFTEVVSVDYDLGRVTLRVGGPWAVAPGVFNANADLTYFYDLTDNITGVGAAAFEGCFGLVAWKSGGGTGPIGADAFKACSALEVISYPACTTVGLSAFKNCTSLIDVQGLESILSIDTTAFEGCTSLASFYLNSCVFIGSQAFLGCNTLQELYAPALVALGPTTSDDAVFDSIDIARPVPNFTLTVPTALATADAGNPDGDITYLLTSTAPGAFEPTIIYI